MKSCLLLILLAFMMNASYAAIPTMDVIQMNKDSTAEQTYIAQIGNYLNTISNTMSVEMQIQQLHSLSELSTLGPELCTLCNNTNQIQLQNYVDQVNTDLCTQFSLALQNITGLKQSISSINGIIQNFYDNPEASQMALQQASVATQTTMQNTLAQIQLLLAQKAQKNLGEQKIEKQTTNSAYIGFGNLGL